MTRRTTGNALRSGAACEPFRYHLAALADAAPPTSWAQVEPQFLAAMAQFDIAVIAGRATEGERQNGKGDYFNELLAIILEAASGASLSQRRGVKGLVFSDYNLDVTFPSTGIAEVLVEAKMLGTPKHAGNDKAGPEGRLASADFPKRLREAGFKTIDLKANYGFEQSMAGDTIQEGPTGSLTTWLREVKPKSYLLAAARVTDDNDLRRMIELSTSMSAVMDGVGLLCYRANDPTSLAPTYHPCVVPHIVNLGKVVHEISQQLRFANSR